jgi:GLPGLI family protein
MSPSFKPVLCLVILSVCLAAHAYGQIYTESVTTGLGNEPMQSQSYYMPKMVKMVRSNGDVMMMRLDKELLIFVYNDKQEYSQMTFAEFEEKVREVQSKVETAMQDMQKKMANLPPEQRQMMERMMGKNPGVGGGNRPLEVKKTGDTRTISGYACTKLAVTQDGKEVLVLWTTKDVKAFAALRRDYEQLATRMAAMMPSNTSMGGGALAQAWPEALKVMDGFPMQQEMAGITTVVTKLEPRSTPASAFEPPAGYTRVEPASIHP